MCCGEYVDVRRQLEGLDSLHHVGSGDSTQVARLGGKCLSPLTHLTSPVNKFSCMFINGTGSVV